MPRRGRLAVDQHNRGRQAYACGAGEEFAIERPQRVAVPGARVVKRVREIKPVRQQANRFQNDCDDTRLCGFHFNEFACGGRGRDPLTLFLQPLQVEFDRIANQR